MVPRRIDEVWLRVWVDEMSSLVERVLTTFETRFGYPPGQNTIRHTSDPDRTAMSALLDHAPVPAELITFYRSVGEVSLPDVGNGIFVHRPQLVLDQLCDGPITPGGNHEGIVFASNGGGVMYVSAPDGAVHRTRDASTRSALDQIAGSVREFLECLIEDVNQFAETGDPGVL
jgi:hypothetical protein